MPAPPRYRRKPEVVEAIRVSTALRHVARDWRSLPAWLVEAYARGKAIFGAKAVRLREIDGDVNGGESDWLILGADGKVDACPEDVFEATYEILET